MRNLPTSDDCLRLCSFKPARDPDIARWNAIIGLLYATGARFSELRELRLKDVSADARGRTTFSISGTRNRQVAVHSRAAELLRRFLGPRPHREDRRIFDAGGRPLNTKALRAELAERSRRLG